MATIQCQSCGKRISDKARSCPKCGEPIKGKTNWKLIGKVSLGVFVIAIIFRTVNGVPENNSHSTSIKHKKELQKTLKGGYMACTTKDKFKEMSSALANKDDMQVGYLMSHGCVLTKHGIRFSYIDGAGFGVAKIRAYDGSDSVILYTNRENVWY